MNNKFKKLLLVSMLTLLLPLQTHGFYGGFQSALANSFAWAKSSCNSILASAHLSVKSYTAPVLVGLGFITTAAFVADYMSNKQELDLFISLKDQLQNQRATKQLSVIGTSHKQLTSSNFYELKELIEEYDSSLVGINCAYHSAILEKYEHLLAMEELQILKKTQQDLQEARKKLLDDPMLQSKVSGEAQWVTLAQHLPDYQGIIKTHFDSHSDKFDASCSNEDRTKKIIEDLEREISACITHVNCPMYKDLKLDKMVNRYLIQLREHANAMRESIKKLKIAQTAIAGHEQQDNNEQQLVINSYDALYKHIEAEISKAQETRTRYRKRFWQVPAALCAMAAVAKVSYTLTQLAFKGN